MVKWEQQKFNQTGGVVEHYTTILVPLLLALIGGLIALGRGLITEPPLKPRVLAGLSILGAATSALAGGVLHFVPNISLSVVISLGCALGLLGHVFIVDSLKKYSLKIIDKRIDSNDYK